MANTVPEKLKVSYTRQASAVHYYEIVDDELATEFANDVRERLNEDYPDWAQMNSSEFQDILLDVANEVFFDNDYSDKSYIDSDYGDTEWSEFDFIKGEE